MAPRDDEDEGDLKEAPPHRRGLAKSEADDEGDKRPKQKPRIDDPDQPQRDGKSVDVDGEKVEIVETIEDLDTADKTERKARKEDDEGDDERSDDESRSRKRRRDRKKGRERDREEIRELLTAIGGLQAEVKSLKEGQKANEEHSEATLLANTKAAVNTVLAQRAQAFADGDMTRVNDLDEALYRLRRQREDLETSAERREKGGGRESDDRRGTEGAGAKQPQWTQPEIRTVRGFIDDEIPWFDPAGGDRDSRKALDISREMGEDHWRPSDPGWAEELRERLEEALPHRFEADDEDDGDRRRPKTRKAPPVGSRGREGGAGGGGGRQFRLTDVHKQALADSGHERGSPEWNSIISTWIREDKAKRASR